MIKHALFVSNESTQPNFTPRLTPSGATSLRALKLLRRIST